MKYRFFTIPVMDSTASQDELNHFLASHKVVSVDKELIAEGRNSLWWFCVSYLDGDGALPATPRAQSKDKIDYREVLSEVDFLIYARVRALRKQFADRDGVPAYAVFTNEQLADMARRRLSTLVATCCTAT